MADTEGGEGCNVCVGELGNGERHKVSVWSLESKGGGRRLVCGDLRVGGETDNMVFGICMRELLMG